MLRFYMVIFIYALIDPRTSLPFYVGKTNKIPARLKNHRSGRGITPCAEFVREIRDAGLRPLIDVLEECTDRNWQEREAYWVESYQSRYGVEKILNVMKGGQQPGKFRKHSEATCERLRGMFIGRPIPSEQKARISQALTGLRQSSKTVAKRMETINANRIAMGLEPRTIYATQEDYLEAQREKSKLARRERRRASGILVRGSEEWKRNAAEKQRAYFEALSEAQKEEFRAKRRGKVSPNKGKSFAPFSEERKAQQSAKLKAFCATLTPEQREARMAAARAARKTKP